jgi:hypothetical protein
LGREGIPFYNPSAEELNDELSAAREFSSRRT